MNTSIYQKMAQVMQACQYIHKGGQNTFHGYSYVTSADVLEKVNQAMAKAGLITTVVPSLVDFRETQNAKGNMDKLATVQVDITVYDTETGELIQFSGIGSGQDTGDKAVMKAETAAIKYAYMLSLCIATGDDPEADKTTDELTHVEEASPQVANPTMYYPQSGRKTVVSPVVPPDPSQRQSPMVGHGQDGYCSDCGAVISTKVQTYSQAKYGVPLCMNCQKKYRQTA